MEKENVTRQSSAKRILLEWLTLVEQLDAMPLANSGAREELMGFLETGRL